MQPVAERIDKNTSRQKLLASALALLLLFFPFLGLAQSPVELVLQAMRASSSGDDKVCEDRTTISNFVNGVLRSQELQEAIVSTPRRGQGIIDLDSSFRELLRVNGKPVPSARRSEQSTPTMTTGGAWLGSTSGWVLSHRNSFEFKAAGPEALNNQTEPLLVLTFERKKGSEAPWFVPDSGKFWINPDSKRLVRMEIHDQDLAPMLSKESRRTIVEDFGSFTIDGTEQWLVKARTLDYYPNRSIQNFKKTHSEYSKCRKFSVSSTIRPQR